MQPLLPLYNKFVGSGENSASGNKVELNQETWEAEVLKEEILKLKLNALHLVNKDLNGMGFNELRQLESKMLETLASVKTLRMKNEAAINKRKILKHKVKPLQLLLKDLTGMGFYELYQVEQELNGSLMSVYMLKDNLKRKWMEQSKAEMQERRGSHLASAIPPPICFGYLPEEKKERPAKKVFASPSALAYGDAANDYYYRNDKPLYLRHLSVLVLLLCVLMICMAMLHP